MTLTQITTGQYHTCALGSNHQAYCWGHNHDGQLGDGSTTQRTTPVAVAQGAIPTGVALTQITAGGFRTCALGSNGKAYCWGENNPGSLGDGTSDNDKPTPVAVLPGAIPAGVTLTQISAGYHHICALGSDGQAYCWGDNYRGQLGDGTTTDRTTPVAVVQGAIPAGVTLTQISTELRHTCALGSNNQAYCWGSSYRGQLGNGVSSSYEYSYDSKKDSSTPVAVLPGAIPAGVTLTQISAGYYHTCALGSNNQAYCWGRNDYGQLGDGSTIHRSTPVAVKTTDYSANFGNISTSQITSLTNTQIKVIAPAHQLGSKQLSLTDKIFNTNTNNLTYTYSTPPTPTITSVSPNQGPTTGNANATAKANNISNLKVGDNWSQISAGYWHTCALDSNHQAYCWGYNYYGQLGGGGFSPPTPIAVSQGAIPAGVTLTQISAGYEHTCALGSNNQAYCWGDNRSDQLGDGSTDSYSFTPVAVSQGDIPAGVTLTQISAGYKHTCTLGSNNKAYCWGNNWGGQLGDGSTTNSSTPVTVSQGAIPAGVTLTQITTGQYHTCALDSNNQAYCWGYNSTGQLGNGTTNNSSTPVTVSQGAIPTGVTLTQISVGDSHTCALGSNHQAYCWGSNGYGQLGDGSATKRTAPVAVLPGTIPAGVTLTQITASNVHTCALGSNNQVYCWGYNYYGQLGNGVTSGYDANSTPVTVPQGAIPAGVTLTQISAGYYHTCALGSTDQAYCWGANNYGQLGTNQSGSGLSAQRYTPAYVMKKSDPLVAFGTTAEHTAGTAGLATSVSSFNVPSGQYYIPGETSLTLYTPPHPVGATVVVVTNADGQSSSDVVTVDLANEYTYLYLPLPDAPTNLVATFEPDPAYSVGELYRIKLEWTAPSTPENLPILDYRIEACQSENSGVCNDWFVFTENIGNVTEFIFDNIPPSIPSFYLSFRVSAINEAGVSQPSNVSTTQTSYITISSDFDTVTINVTPTTAGALSSSSHTVTTTTNHPTGYNLTLSMTPSTNNSLTHTNPLITSNNTISPTTGTLAIPQLDLPTNTWGYRVDNLGSFGAGPTTLETNKANSSFSWAAVPLSTSPDTIGTSPTAITNDQTTIYYAIKTNTNKPAGNYAGIVRYTAVIK